MKLERLKVVWVLACCLVLFPIFGIAWLNSGSLSVACERPVLLVYGIEGSLYSIECESNSFETSFFTNVKVEASVKYPCLSKSDAFTQYVNEALKKEAFELHDAFVKRMSVPEEDLWEDDSDERLFDYKLNLVSLTPCLISFYGYNYTYSGGAHGSVRYITRTFWREGEAELRLDDLLLPGYRKWLFQYCEDTFKLNRSGYYSYDDYSWVGFNPDDLDAFLLTENGLLLIFQNYVISGYEDCPVTLLIPYSELSSIANLSVLEKL